MSGLDPHIVQGGSGHQSAPLSPSHTPSLARVRDDLPASPSDKQTVKEAVADLLSAEENDPIATMARSWFEGNEYKTWVRKFTYAQLKSLCIKVGIPAASGTGSVAAMQAALISAIEKYAAENSYTSTDSHPNEEDDEKGPSAMLQHDAISFGASSASSASSSTENSVPILNTHSFHVPTHSDPSRSPSVPPIRRAVGPRTQLHLSDASGSDDIENNRAGVTGVNSGTGNSGTGTNGTGNSGTGMHHTVTDAHGTLGLVPRSAHSHTSDHNRTNLSLNQQHPQPLDQLTEIVAGLVRIVQSTHGSNESSSSTSVKGSSASNRSSTSSSSSPFASSGSNYYDHSKPQRLKMDPPKFNANSPITWMEEMKNYLLTRGLVETLTVDAVFAGVPLGHCRNDKKKGESWEYFNKIELIS